MRYWKRIVTFLLVFAMLASLVPPVAAESYETITLNQEKAIDLNKVSSVIFSFTPEAEGYYSFQSKDYDEDPKAWIYDSNMDQLYYDDDDGDDWNFDITWFARAGETYYLEAGGAGVYTACVVEKPQATSIELICDAETGYPDGSHYYNLGYQLLPEDCFYETVTFSSSDEKVVSVNDYGEYFMLSPGTAELTVTTASGLTDSCTVTVREPETVQCDETVTVYGEEQERRLLFTPETSGWYGFYSTGDDIDTAGRLLDAEGVELDFNDDGGEGHNFLVKAWLEAGNSYILQADWGSYFDDCTAQLHISTLSAPEGMELNSTVFTGYVDATWQMYYSFTPALSRPEDVTFSSSDETVATVNETGYITVRGAGTAVITATSESGLTASCGVTGKEAPLVTCDDVIYRQGNDALELYKFIPETSGLYCFYSFNAQGDPYGYILSENFSWDYGDDDNGVDMNFMVEAYLEAGEVYYLNPEWNGWGAEDHYEARILRKDAATGLALTYETLTKRVGDDESLNAWLVPMMAYISDVTWTSSDETVATVNDYGEVACLAEGMAVITATTESGLQGFCAVTVKDLDTVLCDQSVTVYEKDEACKLRFIPEISGWYGFYSTGDIDPYGYILEENAEQLAFDNDSIDGHNFLASAWLEAGKTYILEACWHDYGANETALLQITALSAPDALNLNAYYINDYVGSSHWLSCEQVPLISIPQNLTWSSSDETVATVDEDGYVTICSGGTAVITATADCGLTATCTVTGKDTPLVTCDDVMVKHADSEEELYLFIPETSGWYGFYSSGDWPDPYGAISNRDSGWWESNDDNGMDQNFLVKAWLKAGEAYYLRPGWDYCDSQASYEARITPLTPATGLALSSTVVSKQVESYFELNAYFTPLLSVPEEVTWSSSNEVVATVSYEGGVSCQSAGTCVITATSENGLTASCTVTVKDLEIIVCDEPVTVYEADEGCKLRFIPETSGWYGFYSTGSQMNPWGYIWDENGNQLDYSSNNGYDNNFLARAWLDAESTYILEARWDDYGNKGTAQLQVTALSAPKSLTLGETNFDAYAGSECWLGASFSPMLSVPEALTWTSSDETVATVDENGCVTVQGAGTAVITATSESGLTASCTVLGRVAPVVTCEDVIIKYGDSDEELYKFIPETSGWYGFYSTGSQGDPYGGILNQWFDWFYSNDDNGIDDNFLIKAYLDAGEVYYLYPLWDSWSSSDSYEARIAPLTPATGLVLSEDSLSKQVGDDTRLEAVFTPLLSVSEAVTWSSSDESVATVDSDGWVNCLTEGTAVITVTSENGLTASCTVTVKDLETVVCDQSVTVYEEDESCRLRFIPETSGWYGFYSTGSQMSPWGYILDEDGNSLAYNDYNGYDDNFLTRAWLEAGSSYVLYAGWNNYENGYTAQLQVTALGVPESLVLSTSYIDNYAGRKYWMSCRYEPLLSVPEALTWTSSDETVATVDENGCITIQGAGTAVITATSESGLTATCTVLGRVAPLVTCDDVIVKYGNDDYELYKFIPETSGWYGFYSTGSQGNPYGGILNQWFNWDYSNNNNGIDDNFLVKAYLDAGEVYYLYPLWDSCSSSDSYEARIVPLSPATGFTLSHQELTKTVSTRVRLQAYTTPLLSIPEDVIWNSSDATVATVNSYGEVLCLSVGTAVITASTASGYQATCTLTVTEIPTIGLNQILDLDVANGASRHRFTAPQEGWYAFGSLNNTLDTYGTLYDESGNYLTEDDDGGNNNNFLLLRYMQAGETCILESRSYGSSATEGSYQIQVTRPPEATEVRLSTDMLTGFLGKNDNLWVNLMPYGSVPQSMTWTSSDESVVRVDEYGNLEYVSVGTAVITVTTEKGLTDSCTVTVKEIRDIQTGASVTLRTAEGMQMFRFVPEATGVYRFYSTGQQADPWCEVANRYNSQIDYDSDGGDGANFCVYPYLTAGETYYFYVYSGNDNTDFTYEVHLEKAADATSIALSETVITGQPGDRIYLTATLTPSDAAPQRLYWYSSNEDVAYHDYDGVFVLTNEGTTTITVTTASGLTASCQVTVTYEESKQIQCDQPVTLYAANGTAWFSFVPQTSGWYRFFSEGTVDVHGSICDADKNVLNYNDDHHGGEQGYNFSVSYELVAGETYYMNVGFYSEEDISCTVTLEQMLPATGITLYQTELRGYVGDQQYLNVQMVPEFAIPETVVWTSSDETVATVDETGRLHLLSQGTAVITATSENGLTATCTVTVQALQQLYLNKTENMEVSQQIHRFRFIPETTGWYGFRTVGETEMWAELCDENGNEIYYTESVDNMMCGYLEAGKSYSLRYHFDEVDVATTVTLTPISLVKPTEIILENDQLTLYPQMAAYAYYSFQPYECYPESVTWSSSDLSVVEVNEYGVVYAVAPGTTQITVTSESGLTDTLTVVVAELPVDADDYGRCGDNLLWQLKNGILTITGSGDMFDYWRPGPFGKLEMPEGLTSIGAYVFGNQNIGEVVIPSTVILIDYGAFRDSSVACFHFKGSAPEVRNEAFYGVTTTAFYPAEDPTWTDEVRQNYGGNITWIPYYTDEPDEPVEPDVPEGSAGVTVSGSVTTFTEGDTTVELLLNGEVVCTVDVSGKTGTYSFDDVATGTYTLRISKATHVTREYELTVDTDSVTQDVKIHRIGDINGDGKITVADVSKAYAHVKKSTLLTDYEFLCADIISDGRISTADVSKAYAHAKKTTFLW